MKSDRVSGSARVERLFLIWLSSRHPSRILIGRRFTMVKATAITALEICVHAKNRFAAWRRSVAAVAFFLLGLAATVDTSLAQGKAAFLLPGSINDQSWNAQGYQGVEKLKAMGWEVAYTENVQAADMVEGLRLRAPQLRFCRRAHWSLPVGGRARRPGFSQHALHRRLRIRGCRQKCRVD